MTDGPGWTNTLKEHAEGERFGRLTVIGKVITDTGAVRWRCRCDCGNEIVESGQKLRSGDKVTCGCHIGQKPNLKHGHTTKTWASPTWNSWKAMRRRCRHAGHHKYPLYGGRGITIDPRWDDFRAFLEDMGERPPGMTLDRIDPNGNYAPGNCRWATPKEQRVNQRASNQDGVKLVA